MRRFGLGIAGGFVASQAVYPLTHGRDARAPETLGLVVGGLVFLIELRLLGATRDEMRNAIVALAAVGIGVGFSRVALLQKGARWQKH